MKIGKTFLVNFGKFLDNVWLFSAYLSRGSNVWFVQCLSLKKKLKSNVMGEFFGCSALPRGRAGARSESCPI